MTKGTVLNKSQSPSTDIEIKQMKHSPGIAHWTAVKNILRYLRRTKDMFLGFEGVEEELTVRCYTDADFQSDRDDFRSQLGFVFTLNGGAVYWKSSKQSVVADSATESECIVASDVAEESAWMKWFINDPDVV
ncbi:secreted RxLR effector protein 161-like [Helianthus annuus]|uniref:secreted RxLR effector protein 161-like n=1 Tax=Helianthus annuus TaxID=4232 RepID=UPI001653121A|nr:secreted RxLR effector protein 161-like [Helianthus annuus]